MGVEIRLGKDGLVITDPGHKDCQRLQISQVAQIHYNLIRCIRAIQKSFNGKLKKINELKSQFRHDHALRRDFLYSVLNVVHLQEAFEELMFSVF